MQAFQKHIFLVKQLFTYHNCVHTKSLNRNVSLQRLANQVDS